MPKTDLKNIFKNGNDFKLNDIDFNSEKIRKEFKKEVEEAHDKTLAQKEVNWQKLSTFEIKI